MKKTELSNKKADEIRRQAADLEQKKEAWKRYEWNIRHANSGYSELT